MEVRVSVSNRRARPGQREGKGLSFFVADLDLFWTLTVCARRKIGKQTGFIPSLAAAACVLHKSFALVFLALRSPARVVGNRQGRTVHTRTRHRRTAARLQSAAYT